MRSNAGRGLVLGLACGLALACRGGAGTSGTTESSDTTAVDTGSPSGTTSGHAGTTDAVDSSGFAGSTSADTTATVGRDGTTTGDGDGTQGSSSGGDDGLGTIEGRCGSIDAEELLSPDAFTFESSIDFRDLGFDYDQLTPEGQQVFDAGNLGGSSLHSEVVSFEVLARCEGATLLATEGEIVYLDDMGIKTDLLVEIDGLVVGVSVTRAVGFPQDDPYTVMQAETLLTGKLEDILASTANVAPRDAWVKQILHVIAYADMHAESIFDAYAGLPPEITADTVLVVTVTHGNDAFVY